MTNAQPKVIKFCEYCNIGLADMEYFTVDDQEIMCEDCMELHYEWCPEKDDMVKKITTEDIINWKGWTQTDRDMVKRINEIEEEEKKEEEKKEEKKPVLDLDNWKNWTREETHQYLVHMWITKEKEELDGCDIKHIYKMSWFESKRHTISHTEMYYEEEDHTRWGHSNPLCRITVVKVSDDSNEYKSAKHNSLIYRRKEYEEMIEGINRRIEREERERERGVGWIL